MKVQIAYAKSEHGIVWAVIRDPATGMYLLCRRGPKTNNAGQWGFPGGGVDEGETLEQALAREAWEEIVVRLSMQAMHPVIQSKDLHTTWFEIFLKVAPRVTPEVDKFAWAHPHDMHKYALHKSVTGYFRALAAIK